MNYTYVSFEMASSNELCLQWNDFQENLRSSFKLLRQDTDFVDVTLVSEDGQMAEAHMVVLASSSPTLMDILSKNKLLKTFIFMRGTKWKDLVAVLDFIYLGEAKVEEENLESFFALAKDLQLKGLQRKPERETKDSDQVRTLSKYGSDIKMTNTAKSAKKMPEENPVTMTSTFRDMEDKIRSTEDKNQGRMSSNFRDVEEEIRSMVGISKNPPPGKTQGRARVCKVCGISFHILSYFNLSYHIISYLIIHIFARCVEWKATCSPSLSTSKLNITSTASPSPVNTVEKPSAQEMSCCNTLPIVPVQRRRINHEIYVRIHFTPLFA